MSYADFRDEMEKISLSHTDDWCRTCNSTAVFCYGVLGRSAMAKAIHGTMDPTIAGVIGAAATIITLLVLGLIALLVLGIIRLPWIGRRCTRGFRREGRASRGQGGAVNLTHGLDGFDHCSIGADIHTGSWEMNHQGKNDAKGASSVPSSCWGSGTMFDDGSAEEWRLHSKLEPVRVRESV